MKRLLIALAAVLAPAAAIAGSPFNYPVPLTCTSDFYVKPTGNNVANCGALGSECADLAGADNSTSIGGRGRPLTGGDCVHFAAGTYSIPYQTIPSRSGTQNTANGYITYIGAPNRTSKLALSAQLSAGNAFMFAFNGSYLAFVGFEIDGHNIQGYTGYRSNNTNTYFANDGIMIGHSNSHHHMWLNNLIHSSGGSGIGSIATDYTIVAGNEVYDHSGVNGCATSAVNWYQPTAIPSFTPSLPWDIQTYHFQILDNLIHDSGETAAIVTSGSPPCNGVHSDGNGIILDQFNQTGYPYASLIAGNVIYNIGGRGIEVLDNPNALVTNNTTYQTCLDVAVANCGGLHPISNTSSTFTNNIAIGGANGIAYAIRWDAGSATWHNNLTFNSTGTGPGGANNIGVFSTGNDAGNLATVVANDPLVGTNPQLVNIASLDFHPLPTSPVLGAGVALPSGVLPGPVNSTPDGTTQPNPPNVGALITAGPATSFSANPTTVNYGTASTLTWSSTGATSCAGTNFSTGGAASGTASVAPTITTTYTVSCTGTSGTTNVNTIVTVIGVPGPVFINAGGPAASPFIADAGFSGGNTISNWSGAVDVSLVPNPAPQAVYQTERYGTFSYTVSGLTPSKTYTVNLHFTENFDTAAGQRLENVSINGTQVLSNFDIFAAAGAQHKAIVKTFTANADASGNIAISFAAASGSPDSSAKVDGVEVLAIIPSSTANLTASPTSITSGQSSTLTWSSTNATSCKGTGFSTGNAVSGSVAVSPTALTTYTVSCANGGTPATANTTVTVTAPLSTPVEDFQYMAGSWYLPDFVLPASGNPGANQANTIRCTPAGMRNKATINNVASRVYTADTAGHFKFAIYTNGSNNRPATLVATSGSMSTTPAGSVISSALNANVQGGPGGASFSDKFWFCANSDSATATFASVNSTAGLTPNVLGTTTSANVLQASGNGALISHLSCTGSACNGGSSTYANGFPASLAGTTWTEQTVIRMPMMAIQFSSVP